MTPPQSHYLIGVYAPVRIRPRLWIYLLLGIAPEALTALYVNMLAFHNPFATGYAAQISVYHAGRPSLHQLSGTFGGLTWPPQPAALWGLTVAPYHSTFFLSPFLLLALPGYIVWRRGANATYLLFLAIPIVDILAVSMVAYWEGGRAVGMRYLIPMLPFLAFPILFILNTASRRLRFAVYGLMGFSWLNVWLQTLSWHNVMNILPLTGQKLVNVLTHPSPNLGLFLGLNGIGSLIPLGALLLVWAMWLYRFPGFERKHLTAEQLL